MSYRHELLDQIETNTLSGEESSSAAATTTIRRRGSANLPLRYLLAAIIFGIVPLLVTTPAHATPSARHIEAESEDMGTIQACQTSPLPYPSNQTYWCSFATFFFTYKYYRDTRLTSTTRRRCYYFCGAYLGCGGYTSLGTVYACKVI